MGMKIDNTERIYSTIYRNLASGAVRSVLSGCEVTESTVPAMSVDVASGEINYNGGSVSVTGGTVTIEASDPTNPRFDIIAVTSGGALINPTAANNLKGVAAADPKPNDGYDFENVVVLAVVLINNGATSIVDANITDYRVDSVVSLPSGVQGDILYHDGTGFIPLNAGNDGQVLYTKGSGANPEWGNLNSKVLLDANVGSGYELDIAAGSGYTRFQLFVNPPASWGTNAAFQFYLNGNNGSSSYAWRGYRIDASPIYTEDTTSAAMYMATGNKYVNDFANADLYLMNSGYAMCTSLANSHYQQGIEFWTGRSNFTMSEITKITFVFGGTTHVKVIGYKQ